MWVISGSSFTAPRATKSMEAGKSSPLAARPLTTGEFLKIELIERQRAVGGGDDAEKEQRTAQGSHRDRVRDGPHHAGGFDHYVRAAASGGFEHALERIRALRVA